MSMKRKMYVDRIRKKYVIDNNYDFPMYLFF